VAQTEIMNRLFDHLLAPVSRNLMLCAAPCPSTLSWRRSSIRFKDCIHARP